MQDGKRKVYEKPTLVKAGTLVKAADLAANGAGSGPI